jgi:glutathione S-transferase
MKLYFAPGACSLSPHLALRESGLAFTLVRVDLGTKVTHEGDDFTRVNPKGQVPTLVLDDGSVLSEGPAIVQYIADQVPDKGLAPPHGTFARYRLQEWLNYIATELHKTFAPLFNKATPEDTREAVKATLAKRFGWVASQLEGRDHLLGEGYTVADGYLYNMLSWARFVGLDLSPWPALGAYFARCKARPSVAAAIAGENALRPKV